MAQELRKHFQQNNTEINCESSSTTDDVTPYQLHVEKQEDKEIEMFRVATANVGTLHQVSKNEVVW